MSTSRPETNCIIKVREIAEKVAAISPNKNNGYPKSFREAWCEVLVIPKPESEASLLKLIESIKQVRLLFDEAVDSLREIELDEELFVEPVRLMGSTLSNLNVLEKNWNDYRHQFNASNLTSLKFIEHQFASYKQYNTPLLKEEELDKISKQIDEAYSQISKSNLPKSAKNILLDIIQKLRNGIHAYRIRGIKGLKESIGEVIGSTIIHHDELAKVEATPEGKSVKDLIINVNKLYTLAVKAQPVLDAGFSLVKAFLG